MLLANDQLIMNLELLVEQPVHCIRQLLQKSELVRQERCALEKTMQHLRIRPKIYYTTKDIPILLKLIRIGSISVMFSYIFFNFQ